MDENSHALAMNTMNRQFQVERVYAARCLIFGFLIAANAYAADLLDVYKLAEKNDPIYLQEVAKYRAALESRPQALSQLLPSIKLSADTARVDQDNSLSNSFGSGGEENFSNRGYTLKITQAIFRRDRLITLEQADSRIRQAKAELSQAQQDLIMRIAERYFKVLASMDNLEFSQAEVKSLNRQLEQARQRFEVGLSTLTDVQEAEAGYDLAVAREIQALNDLDSAREAIHELSGDDITHFDGLGETIALVNPEPEIIDNWTALSLKQNPIIIAAHHAAETARKEIKRRSAGHYPTLDLITFQSYRSSGGRFGTSKTHTTSIGIELEVPLYSGGLVSSKTREAHENYHAAIDSLEQARRSAKRLTREAYLGVISGISQVKALKQAVISSETALEATEAGFDVGTRTAVDVVASQRATSGARRNHSQAKYDYLLNTLRLKQAVGALSPEDLNLINTWLVTYE